jgi:hypothetical protein
MIVKDNGMGMPILEHAPSTTKDSSLCNKTSGLNKRVMYHKTNLVEIKLYLGYIIVFFTASLPFLSALFTTLLRGHRGKTFD